MSLITKDNKDWASIEKWPNPYNLSEKDQKGRLKNVPLEIITLILKEQETQGGKANLDLLINKKIGHIILWVLTEDGWDFWDNISNGNYQVFYDVYTPEKLRQKLKE